MKRVLLKLHWKTKWGKKTYKWIFYLLSFRQNVLFRWGCGAIQFPSTMTDSKHHNLTFHSGNVLYHPSTSSITPLIWFSFIHIHSLLITPNPNFHFFSHQFPQKHKATQGKLTCKERQSNKVLHFIFLSSIILSHPFSLYGIASLLYLHIVQLFVLVLFWYNFLLFDSLFFLVVIMLRLL